MLVLIFYLIYFQSGVCTHKFTFDGRVMCLHAAFDLLFVGLNTGIVASIDLVVSSGIRSVCVRGASRKRTRLERGNDNHKLANFKKW